MLYSFFNGHLILFFFQIFKRFWLKMCTLDEKVVRFDCSIYIEETKTISSTVGNVVSGPQMGGKVNVTFLSCVFSCYLWEKCTKKLQCLPQTISKVYKRSTDPLSGETDCWYPWRQTVPGATTWHWEGAVKVERRCQGEQALSIRVKKIPVIYIYPVDPDLCKQTHSHKFVSRGVCSWCIGYIQLQRAKKMTFLTCLVIVINITTVWYWKYFSRNESFFS